MPAIEINVTATKSPANRRLTRKRRTGLGMEVAFRSAKMVIPIIRPASSVITASRIAKAMKPGLLSGPAFSASKVELFILVHL